MTQKQSGLRDVFPGSNVIHLWCFLLNPRYNHDKIRWDYRQRCQRNGILHFHCGGYFFLFWATFFLTQKKTPAHHISVKGRGLLLLDSNSVWGDGTTISFYRVSVPFQIFNSPPDAGDPHHRGFASWIMWFIRLWSQKSHVVSKKSTRGTTKIATPSTSMSESSS